MLLVFLLGLVLVGPICFLFRYELLAAFAQFILNLLHIFSIVPHPRFESTQRLGIYSEIDLLHAFQDVLNDEQKTLIAQFHGLATSTAEYTEQSQTNPRITFDPDYIAAKQSQRRIKELISTYLLTYLWKIYDLASRIALEAFKSTRTFLIQTYNQHLENKHRQAELSSQKQQEEQLKKPQQVSANSANPAENAESATAPLLASPALSSQLNTSLLTSITVGKSTTGSKNGTSHDLNSSLSQSLANPAENIDDESVDVVDSLQRSLSSIFSFTENRPLSYPRKTARFSVLPTTPALHSSNSTPKLTPNPSSSPHTTISTQSPQIIDNLSLSQPTITNTLNTSLNTSVISHPLLPPTKRFSYVDKYKNLASRRNSAQHEATSDSLPMPLSLSAVATIDLNHSLSHGDGSTSRPGHNNVLDDSSTPSTATNILSMLKNTAPEALKDQESMHIETVKQIHKQEAKLLKMITASLPDNAYHNAAIKFSQFKDIITQYTLFQSLPVSSITSTTSPANLASPQRRSSGTIQNSTQPLLLFRFVGYSAIYLTFFQFAFIKVYNKQHIIPKSVDNGYTKQPTINVINSTQDSTGGDKDESDNFTILPFILLSTNTTPYNIYDLLAILNNYTYDTGLAKQLATHQANLIAHQYEKDVFLSTHAQNEEKPRFIYNTIPLGTLFQKVNQSANTSPSINSIYPKKQPQDVPQAESTVLQSLPHALLLNLLDCSHVIPGRRKSLYGQNVSNSEIIGKYNAIITSLHHSLFFSIVVDAEIFDFICFSSAQRDMFVKDLQNVVLSVVDTNNKEQAAQQVATALTLLDTPSNEITPRNTRASSRSRKKPAIQLEEETTVSDNHDSSSRGGYNLRSRRKALD